MVAVAGIGRIFGLTDEVVRGDENDGALEIGICRRGSLGVPDRRPLAGGLHPGACQLADDDRKLRSLQVLTDILDQVDQVLFVIGHGVPRIDAIVPALVPDQAGELVPLAFVTWEVGLEVCKHRRMSASIFV